MVVHPALLQALQELYPADTNLLGHLMRMQLVIDELVHALDMRPFCRGVTASAPRMNQLLLSLEFVFLISVVHR